MQVDLRVSVPSDSLQENDQMILVVSSPTSKMHEFSHILTGSALSEGSKRLTVRCEYIGCSLDIHQIPENIHTFVCTKCQYIFCHSHRPFAKHGCESQPNQENQVESQKIPDDPTRNDYQSF